MLALQFGISEFRWQREEAQSPIIKNLKSKGNTKMASLDI